jgi:hypothetical protein
MDDATCHGLPWSQVLVLCAQRADFWWRAQGKRTDRSDYQEVGNLAITLAHASYDPAKGTSIATWLRVKLDSAMRNVLNVAGPALVLVPDEMLARQPADTSVGEVEAMREADDALITAFVTKGAGQPLRIVAQACGLSFSTIGRMREGKRVALKEASRLKMLRYLRPLTRNEAKTLRALEVQQAPKGWQCPVCRRCFAPWVAQCRRCGEEERHGEAEIPAAAALGAESALCLLWGQDDSPGGDAGVSVGASQTPAARDGDGRPPPEPTRSGATGERPRWRGADGAGVSAV